MEMKQIVIVGATSAIAAACARLWLAREPVRLVLMARDGGRAERLAADLRLRYPQSDIIAQEAGFDDPQAIGASVTRLAEQAPIDIALVAHGYLPDQAACQDDLACCRQVLWVNGVSPLLYAEAFAHSMAQAGHGRLALIGSVAGDRGRRSNYLYGAAKAMVARYAEGLQHRFAGSDVRVTLVKPGPTASPMTAHLSGTLRLASAESVARRMVAAIDRGQPQVYAPAHWRLVMWVIRHLPAALFNRLDL